MPWIKGPIGVLTSMGEFFCNACVNEGATSTTLNGVVDRPTYGNHGVDGEACDGCGRLASALVAAQPIEWVQA